ncbi:hypothetical protein J4225_03675 [Candidatus Pacearchaeota archaeon]|nr:hypothetical protein [Candidatus Pacearchaeota archaeon]
MSLKEGKMKLLRNKSGQITLFIIIALVIVGLAVLFYLFFPKIQVAFGLTPKNPQAFMQNCLEDDLQNSANKLSLQGGSLEPQLYLLYESNKIEYLCYQEEYYLPCIVQQPMLKTHIEKEIKTAVREKVGECLDDLEKTFEARGYSVSLSNGEYQVELLPGIIEVSFSNVLTLTQGEEREVYGSADNPQKKIRVLLHNNIYELISIANSIINWESNYGDSETTIYMNYYHDLKVEKYKQGDGSKIYILTDRIKGDKFQFAVRSVAWPPGI